MKTIFKVSTLALSLALMACSIGGKESSERAKNDSFRSFYPSENNSTTASQSSSATSSQFGTATGKGGVVWVDFDDPDYEYRGQLTEASGDTLRINGQTLALGGYTQNRKKEQGSSYFGLAWHNPNRDWNEKLVAYSYGTLTNAEKVPTSGVATYKGTAFYAIEDANIVDAASEFTVDFSTKTVNGRIYNANGINDTLPVARVTGNAFYGRDYERYVQGYFFGENAQEMGGVYEKDRGRDAVSSFGAVKQ